MLGEFGDDFLRLQALAVRPERSPAVRPGCAAGPGRCRSPGRCRGAKSSPPRPRRTSGWRDAPAPPRPRRSASDRARRKPSCGIACRRPGVSVPPSACSEGNGGTRSCNPASSSAISSGSRSRRVESTWPNLTKIGPSDSSARRRRSAARPAQTVRQKNNTLTSQRNRLGALMAEEELVQTVTGAGIEDANQPQQTHQPSRRCSSRASRASSRARSSRRASTSCDEAIHGRSARPACPPRGPRIRPCDRCRWRHGPARARRRSRRWPGRRGRRRYRRPLAARPRPSRRHPEPPKCRRPEQAVALHAGLFQAPFLVAQGQAHQDIRRQTDRRVGWRVSRCGIKYAAFSKTEAQPAERQFDARGLPGMAGEPGAGAGLGFEQTVEQGKKSGFGEHGANCIALASPPPTGRKRGAWMPNVQITSLALNQASRRHQDCRNMRCAAQRAWLGCD
jgi:hypothetical protein